MSTYPMSGVIPQSARYIGEFVPSDMATTPYFYSVVAYDQFSNPLTDVSGDGPFVYGPQVLDGDHAISISWSPVIGAFFFQVFKTAGAAPDPSTDAPWFMGTNETGIFDVGYPCATRNSFLNPGLSPLFAAGCCGDAASVATNVPPAGMAPPADSYPAGGYVRVANTVPTITLNPTTPAGNDGDIQFNNAGRFGADPDLFWDNVAKRLGIHTRTPQQALDVDGD